MKVTGHVQEEHEMRNPSSSQAVMRKSWKQKVTQLEGGSAGMTSHGEVVNPPRALVTTSAKQRGSGVSAGPGHDAWQTHFSAFGAQDVNKTLKDYTDNSTIVVYNQVDGSMMSCEGGDGVKKCCTGLFESLSDTSDLHAPGQVVKEASASGRGTVVLSWSPSSLVTTSANQSGSGNFVAIPGKGICSESFSWRGSEASWLNGHPTLSHEECEVSCRNNPACMM